MATIINNRATANYRYGSYTVETNSNTASVTLNEALIITKKSLSPTYKAGRNITYIITIQNGSGNELTLDLSDNLASYNINGNTFTPLTFDGDAMLFINGVFHCMLTPTTASHELLFCNIVIPPRENAIILYSATPNQYADYTVDSEITNEVSVFSSQNCPCIETVTASTTVYAEGFAELRLIKSGCPNTVVCGEELTYTIDIYNYGNIPASDVTITDTFTPPLKDITVTVNGAILSENDYQYSNGTLIIPRQNSSLKLTVPPATSVQNPTTGIVETIPSTIGIVITGTI